MRTVFRPAVVAAACTMLAAPLAAQTFPTDDAVLRRIWRIGMDSSRVQQLSQVLMDSLGPRLTGTPNKRSAHDWAVSMYRQWGIQARNEQYGTWRGWRRGTSHIDLMTPRVRTLEGTMLAWSPGTGGRPVTAPVVILPELADSAAFVRWLPEVKGRFVLVSMPQPTCRPDEHWSQHATPASFERMRREREAAQQRWNQRVTATGYALGLGTGTLGRRLEQAGAAGVIASRWSQGWGVNKVFDSRNERVPAIDLSCEDYGLAYRLVANGQNPTLRVNADAQLLGEVPSFNTIAEIRGSERPDEYVMLSAHFDSWDAGSGATDNGTGTVVMMEAMRILRQVYPNPKRTIVVGHWGGEEQGLNGSRAYAADNPKVVKGLQALFNQDNGTGRVTNISMMGFANAGAHFGRWFARLPTELTREITLDIPGMPAGGGSDHAAFVCHGAPGFRLGSIDFDYRIYTWHTNRDTYDKIVFDDVRQNAILTAMLVYLASEDPERMPRDRRVMPDGAGWPACPAAARTTR